MTKIVCQGCGGAGTALDAKVRLERCDQCKGRGTLRGETCENCLGVGSATVTQYKLAKCKACSGKGWLHEY